MRGKLLDGHISNAQSSQEYVYKGFRCLGVLVGVLINGTNLCLGEYKGSLVLANYHGRNASSN